MPAFADIYFHGRVRVQASHDLYFSVEGLLAMLPRHSVDVG
jgi:hypothetical protein